MESAIDGGIAVAGSYDGIVIAAEVATGAERWRFQAENLFLSSPALVEGRAYLADSAGHLYALEANSGMEQWRVTVGEGGIARSQPRPSWGTLCIASTRAAGLEIPPCSMPTTRQPVRTDGGSRPSGMFISGGPQW